MGKREDIKGVKKKRKGKKGEEEYLLPLGLEHFSSTGLLNISISSIIILK